MIELRKFIVQELRKYHNQIHYQNASSGATFPYVVYDLPNSFTDGEQEIFSMDVDVWDNKDDTTQLETISSNIWRAFNRYRHIDDKIQLSIYRESRLPPLDESEKNIKRRKLIFQLRYFDRQL